MIEGTGHGSLFIRTSHLSVSSRTDCSIWSTRMCRVVLNPFAVRMVSASLEDRSPGRWVGAASPFSRCCRARCASHASRSQATAGPDSSLGSRQVAEPANQSLYPNAARFLRLYLRNELYPSMNSVPSADPGWWFSLKHQKASLLFKDSGVRKISGATICLSPVRNLYPSAV
jgi:hypothetical protein